MGDQQAYITEVYQQVFKNKETGSESEIKSKIEAKVSKYFAPVYEQWSNNIHYTYESFLSHVNEVNSRSDADFAIEFLSCTVQGDSNIVVVRTVVADTASNAFLSGVLSTWAFTKDRKMLWCKEVLFDTIESDTCGESQDPKNWKPDVTV